MRDKNMCRGISANGVELINLLTKVCTNCEGNIIMNVRHLLGIHKIDIADPLNLFEKIREELADSDYIRVARMWYAHQRICSYFSQIYDFLHLSTK